MAPHSSTLRLPLWIERLKRQNKLSPTCLQFSPFLHPPVTKRCETPPPPTELTRNITSNCSDYRGWLLRVNGQKCARSRKLQPSSPQTTKSKPQPPVRLSANYTRFAATGMAC